MPSPLEDVMNKWKERSNIARTQGIPANAYLQLATQDIQNVARGGSPLADSQVNVSILSALAKQPIIKDPQPRGGVTGFISNVGTDIGGIIRGFIPGLAHLVTNLPSEVSQLPADISSGDPKKIAGDPLLNLIPGVYDAMAAIDPTVRQQAIQHPVSSLLDVLPIAGAIGKTAMAGRAAEAGTAAESLSRGNVIQAATRGGTDTLSHLISQFSSAPVDIRASILQRAEKLTLTSNIRELSRAFSVKTRNTQAAARQIESYMRQILRDLTPEDRAKLIIAAAHRGDPNFSLDDLAGDPAKAATYQHALDSIDRFQQHLAGIGVEMGGVQRIPTTHGEEIYARDSPVAHAHRTVLHRQTLLSYAQREKERWTDEVANRSQDLTDNIGKVRHYGEALDAYTARRPGPVNVGAVIDAVRPLITVFAQGRFEADLRDALVSGRVTPTGATVLRRDQLVVMRSMSMFYDNLQRAQQGEKGALRLASKEATTLARVFKHKSWDAIYDVHSMRQFMGDIRDELIGLGQRQRTHGYAARQLAFGQKKLHEATTKHGIRLQSVRAAQSTFNQTLGKSPPARFMPMVEELARRGLHEQASQLDAGEELLRTIDYSASMADVRAFMGDKLYHDVIDSAKQMWMGLAKAGHNPIWIHHVDPNAYENILNARPLAERLRTPSQFKNDVLNFGPGVGDIAAGVTDAAVEIIERHATEAFIRDSVMPFVRTSADLEKQYAAAFDAYPPKLATAESKATWIKRQVSHNYQPFDPTLYGIGRHSNLTKSQEMFVPVGVAKALTLMGNNYQGAFRLLTSGLWTKSLSLYKFAVLTGPRHIVHVGIGGLMFATLREPMTITKIAAAARMIREGRAPVELLQPIYESGDRLFTYKAGQTLARHFAQVIGDKAHALARFEEWVGNVERVASMLAVERRGVSRDAAIREALKVFIDMDGMSPAERVILKQIFPFYSFTRHLFRYLFTYPVDHPVRAAILARFGEQEQADWKSGLPQSYQQMLFLGQPDASGNIWAVDYKNINPFRSIANDFSLAGFVSALNPVFTAGLQAVGVNVLNATPDLYPGVDFDPVTGSLVATRPNVGLTTVESFIPEVQGLDAIFGLSDRFRRLKESNPAAFQREMFNAFNIPFATSQVNQPYVRERAEMSRFRAAQTQLSKAEQSGNFGAVDRFNLVPYQGTLVPPTSVGDLYARISAALSAAGENINGQPISPKAVMPTKRAVKTSPLTVRIGQ